jgi:hypothetical protein
MEWLTENFSNVVEVVLNLVGAFAVIATMTPNESDNKIVAFVLNVINTLGANFGKASNG